MSQRDLPVSAEFTDLLTELFNIGVGRAAASLSGLIDARIELSVPSLSIRERVGTVDEQVLGFDTPSTVVMQQFDGAINGRALLAFPHESSLSLASLLSGVEVVDATLDAELHGVLLEVGNILLNSVMGTFANAAGVPLNYSLPVLHSVSRLTSSLTPLATRGSESLVVANVQFHVRDREISGSIMLVFGSGSLLEIIRRVEPALMD